MPLATCSSGVRYVDAYGYPGVAVLLDRGRTVLFDFEDVDLPSSCSPTSEAGGARRVLRSPVSADCLGGDEVLFREFPGE